MNKLKRLSVFLSVLILSLISISVKGQQDFKGLDYRFWYQLSVGKGDETPTSTHAWLEIGKPNTTKGFILPRGSIFGISFIEGNFIYNMSDKNLYYGNGTLWKRLVTSDLLANYDDAYNSAQWIGAARTLRLTRINLDNTDITIPAQTLSLVGNGLSISGGNTVNFTTSNVSEGSNLYYTDARARQAINLSNGLSYNNSTGVGTLGGSLTTNTTLNGGGLYSLTGNGMTGFTMNTSGVSQKTTPTEFEITSTANSLFKVANNGDITLGQYGSRNDPGNTGKVLFVDNTGALKYGPVSGGGSNTITINVGTGLGLTGTPTQTISSNPSYTLSNTGVTSLGLSGSEFDFTGTPVTTTGTIGLSIKNNGVALGKIAQIPASTLLGNPLATTGNVSTITIGTGLNLSTGGVLSNSSPDQTVSLTSGTGISATGTYPNFTITNTSPDQTVVLNSGSGISVTGTYPTFTIAATGGGGTVESVGLSMPSIFSVSGSPVTTTGTLTATLVNQSPNLVFAGPSSGGAAAPTFRSLVVNDIPTLTASKISDFVTNARTSISATTPISYNNSTGVITHAVSGVTAGTYNNVTVNTTGHVTSGSNVSYLTTETDPVYIAEKGQPNGAATLGVDGILTLAQRPVYTTSDIAEGTNLYYTDARVQTFSDDRYALQSTTILPLGNGITGGGDLSTNRTFALDFSYLDDRYLSGYKQKTPVRAATTVNITLSGTQTIDGISLVASDRVLVKNQTTGQDNGIYVVAAGAWTRATDFDAASPDEVSQGAAVFVQEGTSFGKTGWSLSTPDPITVGTTPLTFIQYAGANSYTAGTGLSLVGNQFSALTTSALWNANQLQGRSVSNTTPTTGQILQYNGTSWIPFTPNYLTANQTITLSGDVTGSGTTAITTTVGNAAVRTKLSAGTGISYNNSTGVITNSAPDQTVSLTAGTGIGITGTYPNFTISNTDPGTTPTLSDVLTAGNTANNSITLGTAGNTNSYTFNIIRNISSADFTSTFALNSSGTVILHSNGTAAQNQFIRLANGLTGPGYSPNNGTNIYEIWHSNNHVAGSAFTPTLTGANVLASFTSNPSGHITGLTTRTLTASDIGAAPTSGSGNYIQNTITQQSSSNFYLSGVGYSAGSFRVLHDGSATFLPTIYLANAANSRAVNFQLNGDVNPGLSTWIHNGTTNVKRAEQLASNGKLLIYADGGEGVDLVRDGSTVGAATGGLNFVADNASNTPVQYSRIWGVIETNTAGTESGSMQFLTRTAGTVTNKMSLLADGTLNKFGSLGTMSLAASGAELGFTRSGANFIRATGAAGYFNIVTGGSGLTDAESAITIAANNAVTIRGLVTTSTNVTIGGDAIVPTGVIMSGLPAGTTSILGGNRNNYQGGQIALYGGQHASRAGVLAFFTGSNPTGVNPERMTILGTTGFVGINTSAPDYLLHIRRGGTDGFAVQNTGAVSTTAGAFIRMYQSGVPTAVDQRLGMLLFGNNPSGTTYNSAAQISAHAEAAWTNGTSHPTYLAFSTVPSGDVTPIEGMRITSDGKLAIGTSTPAANTKLHVAGNTTTNSVYSESGNDLTLWAQSGEAINFAAGTSAISMMLTSDGRLGIGQVPSPARGSLLEVAGNVWATDAYILGASSSPIGEFGLDGNIFIRSMGTQNINFRTNASTTRMSIVHSTGNVVFEGQVQIKGGVPGVGKVLTSDGSGLATWQTPSGGGGSGTVTSVGLSLPSIFSVSGSPVTVAGTLTGTLATQNANIVFAGPTTGSAAVPTFRSLVVNDIPTLTAAKISDFTTAARATISAGTGISYNSATGVITNTAPNTIPTLSQVLTAGNTSTATGITLGGAGVTAFIPYLSIRSISSINYTAGFGVGAGANAALTISNGTVANDKWLIVPHAGTTAFYSPNGGTTLYDIWHENNHPAGSAFTPTLSGANVLSTMTVNPAGHISALTTRVLTAGDISAAPATGSANYIQNQIAAAQTSNAWITGIFRNNTQFENNSGPSNGGYHLRNVAGTLRWIVRGETTEAGSNSGFDFVILRRADDGSGLGTAMSISRATGDVSIPGVLKVGNQSGIRGTSTGNANIAYLGFYESNGSTQQGYVGKGSTGNASIYVHSDAGQVLTNGGIVFDNTTSNGYGLQVLQEGSTQVTLGGNASSGYIQTWSKPLRINNQGNNTLINPNSGNVGIGNAAPGQKLEVTGNVKADGIITPLVFSSSTTGTVNLYGGATNSYQGGQIGLFGGQHASRPGDVVFYAGIASTGANAERMMIDGNNGNIGVGVSAPTGRFEIGNNAAVELQFSGAAAANIYQSTSAQDFYINSNTGDIFLGANGSGSQHLSILSNGNIGMGVISPGYKLHINSGASASAVAMLSTVALGTTSGAFIHGVATGTPTATQARLGGLSLGSNTSGTTYIMGAQIEGWSEAAWTAGTSHPTFMRFLTTASGSNTLTERMRINAAGNVLIGTATDGGNGKLQVNGNTYITGTITATGGGFNSLRSLKEDISDYTGSGLNLINQVKLYNFKYKNNQNDQFIGMVIDNENTVPQEFLMNNGTAINTYNSISILIKSVQELNTKVESLEKRIEILEKELNKSK